LKPRQESGELRTKILRGEASYGGPSLTHSGHRPNRNPAVDPGAPCRRRHASFARLSSFLRMRPHGVGTNPFRTDCGWLTGTAGSVRSPATAHSRLPETAQRVPHQGDVSKRLPSQIERECSALAQRAGKQVRDRSIRCTPISGYSSVIKGCARRGNSANRPQHLCRRHRGPRSVPGKAYPHRLPGLDFRRPCRWSLRS